MASSTPARKPGASVLKPISRPDADLATLLTAPMVAASASTMSHRPATTRLYGAVTWSPSQSGPRASSTAPSTAVGLQLEQLVVRVDAGRREGGIMHDLRVASLERLADEGDAPGHRSAGAMRRTGPAVAGNVTLGMISSTQAWSCAGSGVMVCRMNDSTPASARAWSEAMTSSGVPNR